jgi:hypothetical protein
MPEGNDMKLWVRTVMMLAGVLLAVSFVQAGPAALALSTGKAGTSLHFSAAFVTIAFDIGQECSKTNSEGALA